MRRQRGLALVFALLLVAAAALFAATAAARTRDTALGALSDRACATARVAAAGGIERARWALAHDAAYAGEILDVGTCSVEVRVARDGDVRRVVAVARSPAAPFAETVSRRVEATLRPAADGLPVVVAWTD